MFNLWVGKISEAALSPQNAASYPVSYTVPGSRSDPDPVLGARVQGGSDSALEGLAREVSQAQMEPLLPAWC